MALSVHPEPILAQCTTLRLGGTAVAEVRVEHADDLPSLAETLAAVGGRPEVLGWGSNILARDGQLPITLLRPMMDDGPALLCRDAHKAVVRCGAGVRLPKLVSWAAAQGLAGIEGLAGIPGTVGGAAAMNAGSYGAEFCAFLSAVDAWTMSEGCRRLERGSFAYGYRSFQPSLSSPWVVVAVELELAVSEPQAIRETIRANLARKKSTQPIHAATAGCVFKNPAGESAGRLLDKAGFKGRTLGGVGFSDLHANFLVNHGSGTADQALELLHLAQQAVAQQFGLNLELEVKVVG